VFHSYYSTQYKPLKNMQDSVKNAYLQYEKYKEQSLNLDMLTHQSIQPLIRKLKEYGEFQVRLLGQSAEGRDIHLIRYGQGETTVFMWSQMHGNEATATMALFDLFNYLADGDSLAYLLKDKLSIYFLPMLNPDGAERGSRYNAWGVDLNRDARLPQTLEAKLLKGTGEILQPHYAFNLHDQQRYYSAGYSDKPATISFLANPQDHECSITPNRRKSMQLVARMDAALQQEIPGHVGRYVASFDNSSFGDTFQCMDICTLLIESGGHWGDPQRQIARKMNFLAILTGLESIAQGTVDAYPHEAYADIPENRERMYDVVLRHVIIPMGNERPMMDIGINWQEKFHNHKRYFVGKVMNFGDLSPYTAYQEHDCRGLVLQAGKAAALDNNLAKYWSYLAKGITHLQVAEDEMPLGPIAIGALNLQPLDSDSYFPLIRDGDANFTLHKDGQVKYAIVNGAVLDVASATSLSEWQQGLTLR
jgi:hypothetical protein